MEKKQQDDWDWTPVYDAIANELGLITATVYGAVWRFQQSGNGASSVSPRKMARHLGICRRTVVRALKRLIESGHIVKEPFLTIQASTDPCTCGYCKIVSWDLEEHHIIPLNEGGGNVPENITYLCTNCHRLIHTNRYKIIKGPDLPPNTANKKGIMGEKETAT